ncbi:MAG: isochorismatase family protein [Deltaproteobacteria bacterium]|jgi:nicotinamidase-related amidase|nr:isochorismatase family protein [Deltaproteobacteria bacterium]
MQKNFDMLTPERCCLMIVDPQDRLMAAIFEAERVVRNASLLIHCAKTLDIPILATTQYKKGLGPYVPELEELVSDVPRIDKIEFNCFANPDVTEMQNSLPKSIDTVILTGAEAHICIFQTAMGALKSGYQPWIAADAVSSREKRNAELALSRMQALGMTVGPTEMAIYELLHKAGSPAFKAMLPHLK